MKTKKCFKCGEKKPLSEFYKHSQMADGHLNKCKECNKKDVRQNRSEKHQYYIDYDRKRYVTNKNGRKDKALSRKSKNNNAKTDWRKRNPEKYKAHGIVQKALTSGLLEKSEICEVCGHECDTQGHHEDYSKPLAVVWVCSDCHSKIHMFKRRAKERLAA